MKHIDFSEYLWGIECDWAREKDWICTIVSKGYWRDLILDIVFSCHWKKESIMTEYERNWRWRDQWEGNDSKQYNKECYWAFLQWLLYAYALSYSTPLKIGHQCILAIKNFELQSS